MLTSKFKITNNKEGGHPMLSLKQAKKGFTIIELLIVIAIIVILAGLVLTNIQGAQAKARDATRLGDIDSVATALEIYHNENGHYPSTFNATPGDTAQLPGIQADALLDERGDQTMVMTAGVATLSDAQTAAEAEVNDDTATSAGYVYVPFGAVGCTDDCTGFVVATYLEQDDVDHYEEEVSLNQ